MKYLHQLNKCINKRLFFQTTEKGNLITTLSLSQDFKKIIKEGNEYIAELNPDRCMYTTGYKLMNSLSGCQIRTTPDINYEIDAFVTDEEPNHKDYFFAKLEGENAITVFSKKQYLEAALCMRDKYYKTGLILNKYHDGVLFNKNIPRIEELNMEFDINSSYDNIHRNVKYLLDNHTTRVFHFYLKEIGTENVNIPSEDIEFLKTYSPEMSKTVMKYTHNLYGNKSDLPYLCNRSFGVNINKNAISGGRFYFGNTYPTQKTESLWKDFMKMKGLGDLHQYHIDNGHWTHQLGYDLGDNIFKIYYIQHTAEFPEKFTKLYNPTEISPIGIRCHSFDISSMKEYEDKYYYCVWKPM